MLSPISVLKDTKYREVCMFQASLNSKIQLVPTVGQIRWRIQTMNFTGVCFLAFRNQWAGAQWLMLGIPALWEAKEVGSLEVRSLRPA